MRLELFALCDAATVSGGKLNLLGAFDSIQAAQLPATHAQCAVAMRFRFNRVEEGEHRLVLTLVDEDGQRILAPIDGTLHVKMEGDEESAVANFIVNIHQLKFERPGSYSIDLAVDGAHECSLPLNVKLLPPGASLPG